MKKLIWSFVILTISLVVTAQTTSCPVHFQRAVNQTETVCDGTGRNQACYGNNTVSLTPFTETAEIDFSMPGDLADVEMIRVLSLSALDDTTGEWGITMMRLLANLNPSSTDDVTLLLFGDVELENAAEATTSQPATTLSVANIRQYPTTSATVVASLMEDIQINAVGKNADSTWIQVHDEVENVSGWIHSDLLTVENLDAVPQVESTRPYFGPMQAFYFRGRNSDGAFDCASIPSDGLYIQTPEGVGRVTIWVNEVTVDFLSNTGSTAFIHPQVDDTMTIDVLEGSASITSDQGGYVAVAGSSVSVDGNTTGSPTVNPPQPLDFNTDNETPATMLDRDVQTTPADESTIATANGLTTTQYNEVVEYGVIITANEPAVQSGNGIDNSSTNNPSQPTNTNGNNGSGTTTSDPSQPTNNNNSTGTTSSSSSQPTNNNSDSNPNVPADTSNNNSGGNGNGNSGNCPGNSCNAPGNSGNNGNGNSGNCPGNSCNAPGNSGNNGNGNGNGNGNNGNGNGNGNNGNGNNGNGNGNGNGNNGNNDNCPGNSCNAPGKNKDKKNND